MTSSLSPLPSSPPRWPGSSGPNPTSQTQAEDQGHVLQVNAESFHCAELFRTLNKKKIVFSSSNLGNNQ